MKKSISILILTLITNLIAAQTAIRGKLIDGATGEPMLFANVGIKGTSIGAISDFDGNFSLESSSLKTGTYDVQVSFVSYTTKIIEGVKVTEGEVTLMGEIRMESSSEQLEAVVVAAEAVKTSETAMLTMKKKSATMLDGISSQEMKLIGDGSAGEAAKRVTGVTVEGGKYVYVRGLGDRYSKTTLNGVDIPGLDPDRNTLQMDIFPTSLIDNITISKNFSAELPADFTGGLVNIDIKDMPEKRIFDVSLKVGFNPQYHFNSDYLQYEGSSTDFLGFDNGSRRLPSRAKEDNIPTPVSGATPDETNTFINSFGKTLGATRKTSLMDLDFGITWGNQKSLGTKKEIQSSKNPKLGYILSLSYKSDYKYYDDVTYGEFQRSSDPTVTELTQANLQTGELGKRSYLVGLMGGLAYKTNLSKIRLQLMHLQNGESTAGKFYIDNNGEAVGQSGYQATTDNLEYNQRSMSHMLLHGKHVLNESGWEVDWRLSPTLSTSNDPDIRKTAFTITNGGPQFVAGAGGNPSRIWRSLVELNTQAKIDITKNYKINDGDAKLRFGLSHIYKVRDYEILFFDVQFFGRSPVWPTNDANEVLNPDNIYPNLPRIYYQSGNNNPNPNAYQSNVNNTGMYISNEWNLFPRLKTIVGLRAENYVQRHTGRDIAYANGNSNGKNLENDIVLNSFDLFPSLNTIFSLKEEQNLRFSYSRTIARPSFKELSFAQIVDPLTNRIFNGSLFEYPGSWDGDLKETRIDNIDFRWERFMKSDQMVSVSAFYKRFDKPIEMVRIPEQQTSTEFQARNVGNGQLVGLEFELRKSLSFISDVLKNYKFSGNVTLIQSQIDMSDKEYNARKQYEKEGQSVKKTREMAGQAPWVVNAGVLYSNLAMAMDVGIFYNVKGPTLQIVGTGLYSDIYQEPFHSLNFSLNKKLGQERNTQLKFNIENILNDRIESFFQSYNAKKQAFISYNPGMTFSVGISHKF